MFSLVLLIAAIVGKLLGAIVIKESWASKMMIGMSMVPRGEVGLIFAEIGHLAGIFTNEIHAGLVLVIVLTTIIPPFVMKCFYKKYSHLMKN